MSLVSAKLLTEIVYGTNASNVWKDLKQKFDNVNHMRLYQLHREINNHYQGADFVSTYFIILKNLWSEYEVIVPAQSCTFPKFKEYANHLHQLRLIQFLSG